MKYKKITRKTFDYIKNIPKCPSKGAFEINYFGYIYFVLDGKRHRTDGPAIIWPNGTLFYCQHGERHRIDGPAWIFPNGDRYYFQHDKVHREDGPAVISPDGSERYSLFGQEYPKEIWETKVAQLRLKEQIL